MDREPLTASHVIAVAAAMTLGVIAVVPTLAWPLEWDAAHSYLPMAKRLLAEGGGCLKSADSLATGIVAFAWPALLGANEGAVRAANVMLYAAVIALAFVSLRAAHSNRAGVLAAFLVALSPVLHPHIANVMTEPPFIFFIAVWIASIAAVMRGSFTAGALIGGVAFALATLTRPATMWFPVVAAALFAWRARRAGDDDRRIDASLALMHVFTALLIGAFVARNAIEFGYPS